MNFVHKQIAKRVVESILRYDLDLLKSGNSLEIIGLEKKIEDIKFYLNEEKTDFVTFYGFIDRVDLLNGNLRIIDYKTAKAKDLRISVKEDRKQTLFFNDKYKQALQLCIYQYCVENMSEFKEFSIETGIWSFAEVKNGVQNVEIKDGNLEDALQSVRNLILEILNPEVPFTEKIHEKWS